jgi:hypothetical protein
VRLIALSLFLGAVLIGCSLSDYEKTMEYQQQRVDYLDRQAQAITRESIGWPERKQAGPDATQAEKQEALEALSSSEIYFRPPIGYLTSPNKAVQKKIFQQFKATDNKLPYDDILIAAARTSKQEKFRDDVCSRLKIKMKPEPYKPGLLGKEVGNPVDFDYCYDDYGTKVFFRADQGIQVAIAFRPGQEVTDEKLRAMEAKIDYSLPTLSLGLLARRGKPPQK